jgi:hypothetical protein
MPRDDTLLLIISCCVAGKFKDLSSEIFENGREID